MASMLESDDLTESDNATRDGHHPKHAIDCGAVGSCSEDAADDDHQGGEDDGCFTAKIVACESDIVRR